MSHNVQHLIVHSARDQERQKISYKIAKGLLGLLQRICIHCQLVAAEWTIVVRSLSLMHNVNDMTYSVFVQSMLHNHFLLLEVWML